MLKTKGHTVCSSIDLLTQTSLPLRDYKFFDSCTPTIFNSPEQFNESEPMYQLDNPVFPVDPYIKRQCLRGEIVNIVDDRAYLRTPFSGYSFGFDITGDIEKEVREAHSKYDGESGAFRVLSLIELDCDCTYDSSDKLIGIKNIYSAQLLDPFHPSYWIDTLRTLEDGWYDGDYGTAIPQEELDWLDSFFRNTYQQQFDYPMIAPEPDDGDKVSIEWHINRTIAYITVDLLRHKGEVDILGEGNPFEIDFDDETAISSLINRLREIKNAAETDTRTVLSK